MSEVDAGRGARVGQAFVKLAESLVNGFDIVELLEDLAHTCVDVLGASAAGLMLTDQRGGLRAMGASSEDAWLLELLEIQNDQGPCLDCYRSGEPLAALSDSAVAERWPLFAPALAARGFGVVYACPLRLRDDTIGALNLFLATGSAMSDDDLQIAQALADVATIAILQHRSLDVDEILAEHLQTALDSRVVIEQAKGVIAQHAGADMNDAFALLRAYSHSHRSSLSAVAAAVASGELAPGTVVQASPASQSPES